MTWWHFREDEEKRRRRALKTTEDDDGIQEEEEVPSMTSIKRQSQLLVTAKQTPGVNQQRDRRSRRWTYLQRIMRFYLKNVYNFQRKLSILFWIFCDSLVSGLCFVHVRDDVSVAGVWVGGSVISRPLRGSQRDAATSRHLTLYTGPRWKLERGIPNISEIEEGKRWGFCHKKGYSLCSGYHKLLWWWLLLNFIWVTQSILLSDWMSRFPNCRGEWVW